MIFRVIKDFISHWAFIVFSEIRALKDISNCLICLWSMITGHASCFYTWFLSIGKNSNAHGLRVSSTNGCPAVLVSPCSITGCRVTPFWWQGRSSWKWIIWSLTFEQCSLNIEHLLVNGHFQHFDPPGRITSLGWALWRGELLSFLGGRCNLVENNVCKECFHATW